VNDNYQVISDGTTVWVNHSSGYCAARFGRFGIDIHNSPDDQERTGEQCLYCTHGAVKAVDWITFTEKVMELFGVTVEDKHCPDRLRC
jgi:hypothetical protein